MFVTDALKTIENYNSRATNGENIRRLPKNSLHENLRMGIRDAVIAGSIQKLFFY
jgi:hypothetical protein